MLMFIGCILIGQECNRLLFAFGHMPVKHRYKPAMLLGQHSMARTRKGFFQRTPLRESTIEVFHKGGVEVILDRERHGHHGRYLRCDQRSGKCGIDSSAPPRVTRVLLQQCSGFTGSKDCQSYITTQKQVTQRLGPDEALTTLFCTEAEIRLRFDAAEGFSAPGTLASTGIIHLLAVFVWAEATIGTMPIEVNHKAGD